MSRASFIAISSPPNIFLTPHGVEDPRLRPGATGVACRPDPALTQTATRLTRAGTMMGTPRYMSPEQIQGQFDRTRAPICLRWGRPCIEMLAGTPAFGRRNEPRRPPCHTARGARRRSAGRARSSRSIGSCQRLLAKSPDDRPASASAGRRGSQGLPRARRRRGGSRARTMTWLIVLPFRVFARGCRRPTSSPSAFPTRSPARWRVCRSLGVRSTAGAARFAAGEIDFARIASEAHVDLVMTGTLLRAGDGDSRDDAAGRRAGRRGAVVARRPCHAARRVSATGRSRPAHRRLHFRCR